MRWSRPLCLLALAVPTGSVFAEEPTRAQTARERNQVIALKVADRLRPANLGQIDISIRFQADTLTLTGHVRDALIKRKITRIVRTIPEVKQVENDLATKQSFKRDFPLASGRVFKTIEPLWPPGTSVPVTSPLSPPKYAWPRYANDPHEGVTSPVHPSPAIYPGGPFHPYPQVPLGWKVPRTPVVAPRPER